MPVHNQTIRNILVFTCLSACGSALAQENAENASPNGGMVKIDTRWVTDDVCGAVVIHPQQIGVTETGKRLGVMDILGQTVLRSYGQPTVNIEQATILLFPPDDAFDDPIAGIVLQFAKPIDQDTLREEMKKLVEAEHKGKQYYVENHMIIGGDSACVYAADEQTLIVAGEERLHKMLDAGGKRGWFVDRLEEMSATTDVLLALDIEPMRKYVDEIVEDVAGGLGPEPPPPLAGLPEIHKQMDKLVARLDLSDDQLLVVSVQGRDQPGSDRLEKTARDGIDFGKKSYEAARGFLADNLPEEAAPKILALTDALAGGVKVARKDNEITVSIPKSEELLAAADVLGAMLPNPADRGGFSDELAWEEYVSPTGGFRVEIPQPPHVTTYVNSADGHTGGNASAWLHVGDEGLHLEYDVTWSKLGPGELKEVEEKGSKEFVAGMYDAEKSKGVQIAGHDGVEYSYESSLNSNGVDYTMTISQRAVVVGDMLYTLQVETVDELLDQADFERFFNSFKLLDMTAVQRDAYRGWSNGDGRSVLEAKLAKIQQGSAILEKYDGQTQTVALSRLAPSDQKYIRDRIAAALAGREARPDGLLHHWAFDDGEGDQAADAVAGNSFTFLGFDDASPWVKGKLGGAAKFSGGAQAAISRHPILNQHYTLAFWLQVDPSRAVNPRVVAPITSRGDWIVINNEFKKGVGFYFNRGASQVQAPKPPAEGAWEHYAVAIDLERGMAAVFRDGERVSEGRFRDQPPIGQWILGHNSDLNNANDSLQGSIDDLRVYDWILAEDDVKKLIGGDADKLVKRDTRPPLKPGETMQIVIGNWRIDPNGVLDANSHLGREGQREAAKYSSYNNGGLLVDIEADGAMTIDKIVKRKHDVIKGTWKLLSEIDDDVVLEFTEAESGEKRKIRFHLYEEYEDYPRFANMQIEGDVVQFSIYRYTKKEE